MGGWIPTARASTRSCPASAAGSRSRAPRAAFLILPDGRRILDAAGGAVVASIGHGRQEVAEVAARALATTSYVVPPFATEERVRLVERLRASWLPAGITRCVFASGGSEAIDLAIRIARQHFVSKGEPARWKVIGRELSYHGTTLSGLDVGGHPKRRKGMEPWLHDLPKAPRLLSAALRALPRRGRAARSPAPTRSRTRSRAPGPRASPRSSSSRWAARPRARSPRRPATSRASARSAAATASSPSPTR